MIFEFPEDDGDDQVLPPDISDGEIEEDEEEDKPAEEETATVAVEVELRGVKVCQYLFAYLNVLTNFIKRRAHRVGQVVD